jgi:hypothetical protein
MLSNFILILCSNKKMKTMLNPNVFHIPLKIGKQETATLPGQNATFE